MKSILIVAAACVTLTGCSVMRGDRTPAAAATAPGEAAAAPGHAEACSQLRADIASSEHNQRTVAPATSAPIIAAASEGKTDQRIEALRQRYAELGCVGTPPPTSGSPTH